MYFFNLGVKGLKAFCISFGQMSHMLMRMDHMKTMIHLKERTRGNTMFTIMMSTMGHTAPPSPPRPWCLLMRRMSKASTCFKEHNRVSSKYCHDYQYCLYCYHYQYYHLFIIIIIVISTTITNTSILVLWSLSSLLLLLLLLCLLLFGIITAVMLAFEEIWVQKFRNAYAYQRTEIEKRMTHFKSTFPLSPAFCIHCTHHFHDFVHS